MDLFTKDSEADKIVNNENYYQFIFCKKDENG